MLCVCVYVCVLKHECMYEYWIYVTLLTDLMLPFNEYRLLLPCVCVSAHVCVCMCVSLVVEGFLTHFA